ncbi:hypothetical protein Tco_1450095 [Tanacetum coccineum]
MHCFVNGLLNVVLSTIISVSWTLRSPLCESRDKGDVSASRSINMVGKKNSEVPSTEFLELSSHSSCPDFLLQKWVHIPAQLLQQFSLALCYHSELLLRGNNQS